MFKLYINNIDQVYKSDNITNYKIYDNTNVKKYGKRRLTLTFKEDESGYDTISEVEESEDESEDENNDTGGVVESKKPEAKKTKAPTAKKGKDKWSENEKKFVAFYLFYDFLISKKINDLTIEKFIDEYDIIGLLMEKRKKYDKEPSLGIIVGSLLNEWSNSEFKEIRLDKQKQETDWEKDYKKKYRDGLIWPLVQMKNAVDRFMRVVRRKGKKKVNTVGEALDVFYKEVIMQNNKPDAPGPKAIERLATYEKKD